MHRLIRCAGRVHGGEPGWYRVKMCLGRALAKNACFALHYVNATVLKFLKGFGVTRRAECLILGRLPPTQNWVRFSLPLLGFCPGETDGAVGHAVRCHAKYGCACDARVCAPLHPGQDVVDWRGTSHHGRPTRTTRGAHRRDDERRASCAHPTADQACA